MCVSEETRGGMAKSFIRKALIPVGAFAHGEVFTFALFALAADDGEGDHNTIPHCKRAPRAGTHFDDHSHGFMAHDIARLHSRHKVVEKMQIGSTDRTAGDFDYGVALMLNSRIRNRFAANVRRAMPNERLHSRISAVVFLACRTLTIGDRSKRYF